MVKLTNLFYSVCYTCDRLKNNFQKNFNFISNVLVFIFYVLLIIIHVTDDIVTFEHSICLLKKWLKCQGIK